MQQLLHFDLFCVEEIICQKKIAFLFLFVRFRDSAKGSQLSAARLQHAHAKDGDAAISALQTGEWSGVGVVSRGQQQRCRGGRRAVRVGVGVCSCGRGCGVERRERDLGAPSSSRQ